MKGLTANQTNWVMWISSSPLTEGMWKNIAEEAEDIMRRGRNDELLLQMMVAALSYLEKINK